MVVTFMQAAALAAVFASVPYVQAHGNFHVPTARQHCEDTREARSQWIGGGSSGGGYWSDRPAFGGVPGLCGDPFGTHEGTVGTQSDYAGTPCVPQETYQEGSVVSIEIDLLANHGGFWEVYLCDSVDITQDCFDQHKLLIAGTDTTEYWIMEKTVEEPTTENPDRFIVDYQLPAGVTCDHCVFQWTWWTATHCGYECDSNICGSYADQLNPTRPDSGATDICPTRYPARGEAPQIFRNCADITIEGDGSTTQAPLEEAAAPGPASEELSVDSATSPAPEPEEEQPESTGDAPEPSDGDNTPEPDAPEPDAPEPDAPEPADDAPEPDTPEPDAPEPDAPEPADDTPEPSEEAPEPAEEAPGPDAEAMERMGQSAPEPAEEDAGEPADSDVECDEWQHHKAYEGHDYKTIDRRNEHQCKRSCQRRSSCNAVTYYSSGSDKGTCELKSIPDDAVATDNSDAQSIMLCPDDDDDAPSGRSSRMVEEDRRRLLADGGKLTEMDSTDADDISGAGGMGMTCDDSKVYQVLEEINSMRSDAGHSELECSNEATDVGDTHSYLMCQQGELIEEDNCSDVPFGSTCKQMVVAVSSEDVLSSLSDDDLETLKDPMWSVGGAAYWECDDDGKTYWTILLGSV